MMVLCLHDSMDADLIGPSLDSNNFKFKLSEKTIAFLGSV